MSGLQFGVRTCLGHKTGDEAAVAGYIWTAQPSGNEIPLCASCCALWRADAEAGRCPMPSRVRQAECTERI